MNSYQQRSRRPAVMPYGPYRGKAFDQLSTEYLIGIVRDRRRGSYQQHQSPSWVRNFAVAELSRREDGELIMARIGLPGMVDAPLEYMQLGEQPAIDLGLAERIIDEGTRALARLPRTSSQRLLDIEATADWLASFVNLAGDVKS